MEAIASEILSKEEILRNFPNQWVLIGNPELDNLDSLGTILSKLLRGTVLLSGNDKREIGYKAKEARKGYESVTLIFSGEVPQNRK